MWKVRKRNGIKITVSCALREGERETETDRQKTRTFEFILLTLFSKDCNLGSVRPVLQPVLAKIPLIKRKGERKRKRGERERAVVGVV